MHRFQLRKCEGGLIWCFFLHLMLVLFWGEKLEEKWRIKQRNVSGLVHQMSSETKAEGWNWPVLLQIPSREKRRAPFAALCLPASLLRAVKNHFSAPQFNVRSMSGFTVSRSHDLTAETERWHVGQQASHNFDPFTAWRISIRLLTAPSAFWGY